MSISLACHAHKSGVYSPGSREPWEVLEQWSDGIRCLVHGIILVAEQGAGGWGGGWSWETSEEGAVVSRWELRGRNEGALGREEEQVPEEAGPGRGAVSGTAG